MRYRKLCLSVQIKLLEFFSVGRDLFEKRWHVPLRLDVKSHADCTKCFGCIKRRASYMVAGLMCDLCDPATCKTLSHCTDWILNATVQSMSPALGLPGLTV